MMSYEASPYNGRGDLRVRGRGYDDSRKRFRGNGVLRSPGSPEKRRFNYYDQPNDQYRGSGYQGNGHRMRSNENRYPDSRHPRDAEFPSFPKRSFSGSRFDNQDPPKPSRIIGAFGLAPRTEERHLSAIMKKYGDIEQVKILRDSASCRSRGFGFVYFQTVEGARTAKNALSKGLDLHGKVVRIDYSFTNGPYMPTPGVYLGREKEPIDHIDSGRRTSYEGRRRSPIYESPKPFRDRRLPPEIPDNFFRKPRPNRTRSRSPIEPARDRMPRNDGRSYRPRQGRGGNMGRYDGSSRHTKNDMSTLDRTPPSR